ncbi:MAG: 50S ribosomal protein L25 [Candidatus Omnitrophota bacterium]|jgi:large subunit ribosomal protein L25|nr:MAG: 50S ribosomal protein L25 [Candidatus Omnitrophota bacterium]
MDEIFLDVEARQESGKTKSNILRKQGFIPAVVYKEGKESQPIKVSRHDFIHLSREHHLESVIVNLRISDDKKKKSHPCLVKEIQYEPVHGGILHVDFNEISLTKLIKVNVGVVAKGEPIGVKQEGGSLEHILWELEVECLPTDIPKEFTVDVSQLKIGDTIHVRDITSPSGVKILNDPDAVVLSVASPMKEEVVEVLEGEEKAEPEVIKEKKEVPAEDEEEPQAEKK